MSCLGINSKLETHAQVFLCDWKDSRQNDGTFIKWSNHLVEILNIEDELLNKEGDFDPVDDDSYELIEKFCIRRLIKQFSNTSKDINLLELIKKRKNSFWFEKHKHAYHAIELAIQLLSLIKSTDLKVTSFEKGVKDYCTNWWRIDRTYRCCVFHIRSYGQPGLMKPLREWVENQYVNNALRPLTNNWSDQINELSNWSSKTLQRQRN